MTVVGVIGREQREQREVYQAIRRGKTIRVDNLLASPIVLELSSPTVNISSHHPCHRCCCCCCCNCAASNCCCQNGFSTLSEISFSANILLASIPLTRSSLSILNNGSAYPRTIPRILPLSPFLLYPPGFSSFGSAGLIPLPASSLGGDRMGMTHGVDRITGM